MQSQLEVLEERRQRLLISLANAKKARDEADGKMQSRYDTQKEDAAQEVAMYEAMIADIEKLMQQLQVLDDEPKDDVVAVGRRVEIEFDDGDHSEFLLLDDQGGVDLGDIQTISTKSPVGSAIVGAKPGETMTVRLPTSSMEVRIVSVT